MAGVRRRASPCRRPRVRARIGPLLDVIRSVAAHDPDIDALWSGIQTEFYDNQRSVVEALYRNRALKSGLTVARATDILWTLNHPNVYRLFVTDRQLQGARRKPSV
jgi:hypothetical protein